MFDFLEDFLEEFTSFRNDMREIKHDFQEVTTEGFKEIVIKGNDNYKTSSELRHEASIKISSANDKLAKAQEKTKKCAKELYKHHTELEEYRNLVFNHYSPDDQTIKNIAHRTFDASLAISKLSWTDDDEYILPGVRLIPEPWARKERISAAKEYLQEAEDYTVYVDAECVRLHNTQILISTIEQAIKEELRILNILKIIARRTSSADRAFVFGELSSVIRENLLTENSARSAAYSKALGQLKSICRKYETA